MSCIKQGKREISICTMELEELPDLDENMSVWMTTDTNAIPGRIALSAETPRSYITQTPTGEIRRNRSQLRVMPEYDSIIEGS